jgi:hypothetical protein
MLLGCKKEEQATLLKWWCTKRSLLEALYVTADFVSHCYCVLDDDQWRYSPDQALASLYGFHDSFIVRCGVISSTIDLI